MTEKFRRCYEFQLINRLNGESVVQHNNPKLYIPVDYTYQWIIHTSGLYTPVDYTYQWIIHTSGLYIPVDYTHHWIIHTSGLYTPVDYTYQWIIHTSGLYTPVDYTHQWIIHTSGLYTPVDYTYQWIIHTSGLYISVDYKYQWIVAFPVWITWKNAKLNSFFPSIPNAVDNISACHASCYNMKAVRFIDMVGHIYTYNRHGAFNKFNKSIISGILPNCKGMWPTKILQPIGLLYTVED